MQAICSLEPSEPLVVFAKMKQECLRKLWLSAREGGVSHQGSKPKLWLSERRAACCTMVGITFPGFASG